jgi:hypothetical protein
MNSFSFLLLLIILITLSTSTSNILYGRYESSDGYFLNIYDFSYSQVLVEGRSGHVRSCQLINNNIKCHHNRHAGPGNQIFNRIKFSPETHLIVADCDPPVESCSTEMTYKLTNPLCSIDDNSLYSGQWSYGSEIYNKSELFEYCPIFRNNWPKEGHNRDNYDCDGYRHAEYHGGNNCTVMTIAASLKKARILHGNGTIKNGILFIGDSLSFIHKDVAHCELEHHKASNIFSASQAWREYISSQPACCDYCSDPTSKEEHFNDHCPNCYNASNIKEANIPGKCKLHSVIVRGENKLHV